MIVLSIGIDSACARTLPASPPTGAGSRVSIWMISRIARCTCGGALHTCFWFNSFHPSPSGTSLPNAPFPSLVIGFCFISMGWLVSVSVHILFPLPDTMWAGVAFFPVWGWFDLFCCSWFQVVVGVLALCCEGWCFQPWFWWVHSCSGYHGGTYHSQNDFSPLIRPSIGLCGTLRAFSRRKTQLNHLQRAVHADR